MPAKPVSANLLTVADRLLAWYDVHRRALPWRARAGEAADPYRVWLSEVMLQQTTVASVRPRFLDWVARWPDLASLAAADGAEVMAAWAGLGYYARARNLLKTAQAVVAEHGSRFPADEAALRTLPGLGAYTAAAVAAIAFGQRAVVVDANVERVVARLRAIATPLPAARPAIRAAADAITPTARAGDFAQAMMDLGATVCTPRRPRCLLCPLREDCAGYATGRRETFPVKAAKRAKPQRYGTVFALLNHCRPRGGDEILLVRRPARGLLGGMRALPTGPWTDAPPGLAGAPAVADWTILPATVAHGFTHFDLQLALAVARGQGHGDVPGDWWPVADLAAAGLPTVFAKAARLLEPEP
ncbi:A/G-specific adenine glycosylase [Sphingomonas sp.]|uniref:A/G-specific adenine glycosylase n=1 Tax=Sphingomonas sp. TaxID=28214 RepID=UPI003CC6B7FC